MTQRFIPPTARWAAAVCLVATFAFACNKNTPIPSPTAPAPVDRITEDFTGSFGQLGVGFNTFTITLVGPTEITLVALAPLASLTVGMGVGTPVEGETTICGLIAQDSSVRVGDTFLVSDLVAGTYCVAVFDVGNVFPGVQIDYSLSVTHP